MPPRDDVAPELEFEPELDAWAEAQRSELDYYDELHKRRLKVDALKQGISWRAATRDAIQRIGVFFLGQDDAEPDEALSLEDQAFSEVVCERDPGFRDAVWSLLTNEGELDDEAARYLAERAQEALRPKFSALRRSAGPRSMSWRPQHGCHGRHRRASRPAPVRHRGSRRSATRGSPSSSGDGDSEPASHPVTPARAGALTPAWGVVVCR